MQRIMISASREFDGMVIIERQHDDVSHNTTRRIWKRDNHKLLTLADAQEFCNDLCEVISDSQQRQVLTLEGFNRIFNNDSL
jgi:hypothetical protein